MEWGRKIVIYMYIKIKTYVRNVDHLWNTYLCESYDRLKGNSTSK